MPSADVRAIEDKLKAVTAEKEEAILAEDFEAAASLRDREKDLQLEYDTQRMEGKPILKNPMEITEEDVAEIVTAWTGIPVSRLAETESDRLSRLEELLSARVIGQREAVQTVSRTVRRGRAGLKDPRRPVGSLLFLGPTGVGKTELARALADVMYGGESALIRVDMSEYMDKFTTSRMVGSPPGYVGYDEGGQLTERVRRKPYSVVLFDEIEKAHPDVFHLLLQILEDGTLTDSRGRRVDFSNTVIIMTSNVGATEILEPRRLGFAAATDTAAEYGRIKDSVRQALERTFRPEFLNRIDEIITFTRLTEADLTSIASRMLAEVTKRISALGIGIKFSGRVAEHLAQAGADPRYGARPLRRTFIRLVEDSFSEELLSGRIHPGDSVEAVWEDGAVRYLCRAGAEK